MSLDGGVLPPDVIRLRGLRLTGIVGVLPEERTRAQPLCIDLDLHVDLSAAGVSDALDDTVDYGAVCDLVAAVVAGSAPKLLERLASQIAGQVLDLDPRIDAVDISVDKLRPPVPHGLETSGVRLSRRRPS
ncbi:MAG TPA: dihydroneopterin aldolase [Microthrixaceae bacterium]|nr:dihydroneopterin aldolase [Microthrixaceae bacterium]